MRVAIVSIRFDNRGGSERRTCRLVEGLVGAGHEVEVFAAYHGDTGLAVKVDEVPVAPGPSFMKVMSFTRAVNRMLSGGRGFDVVHNQVRPFTDGVVTVGGGCHAEYLERSGKKFAWLNPLHRVILGMEKAMYREGGCKAVITNSELARRGILKHYPMPEERVFVAYNGVDAERFRPAAHDAERDALRARLGITGDGPVALFVGAGFERKGLSTLVRALPRADGFRVLVAGKGDRAPYRRLADGLGVGESVVFVGETKEPELLYRASDVFVLPTLFDPFSNATLEAMASGLPVVTTRQNGVSEIITDGVDGFLLGGPDDHDGLSAVLARLSDAAHRKRVGGSARGKAAGLTWEKTLEKTLEVYRWTASA